MTNTEDLMGMIIALRERLEQAQELATNAGSAVTEVMDDRLSHRIHHLQTRLLDGKTKQQALQWTLDQAREEDDPAEDHIPEHLTAQAESLIEQTRDLLQRLRKLGTFPALQADDTHPLSVTYHNTVLTTELILRTLLTLPEKPRDQLHFCSGAEVMLEQVMERIRKLHTLLKRDTNEDAIVAKLDNLLVLLAQGRLTDLNPFFSLAESIAEELTTGQWLRFRHEPIVSVSQFTAGHSLSVARVIARVGATDPEWRSQLLLPIVAALVHDVGMLSVPLEVLTQTSTLDVEQRVLLERHPRIGANMIARIAPDEKWLADAALTHHERPDCTGYPVGLADIQIEPLVKLLSVCDVYAALNSSRPHRDALDSRSALTDTFAIAQNGGLDRQSTRSLYYLTSYPCGACVELADGRIGIVTAKQTVREEVDKPLRPAVLLLLDASGDPLPYPIPVDLTRMSELTINRGVPPRERRRLLGSTFPQWA